MAYKYAKLKGKIIEKYGSQGKFAEQVGLSETSMSKKLNYKSGFSQDEIEMWSELLDIERNEYGEYFFT